MVKKSSTLIFCLACTIMLACACDDMDPGDKDSDMGVFVILHHPQDEDAPQVRALNTDFKFSFASSERIDVFAATAGEKMIYRGVPYDENPQMVKFQVENFQLKDATYYSLYPSQGEEDDPLDIPVSFLGQEQSADNDASHLSGYDFNVANATISNGRGNFDFTRLVALVRLKLKFPQECRATSVTLHSAAGFYGTGNINVVSGTMTPAGHQQTMTLTLGGDGFPVERNGTLTVFFALSPREGAVESVTVRALDGNDQVISFSGTIDTKDDGTPDAIGTLAADHGYKRTVTLVSDGNVSHNADTGNGLGNWEQ